MRNPDSATPYDLLGRVYLAAGQTDKARKVYEQLIEIDPGNAIAYHTLADFALSKGDYDGARAFYQEILKHTPDSLPTTMRIAASYALQGDSAQMVATLQKAITAHPQAIPPKLVLARYYISRGRAADVAPLLHSLSQEQQSLPEVLAVQAASQVVQKSYSAALMTIDRLIGLQPAVGHYHYLRAMAFAGLNEPEKTRAELLKVVEFAPTHVTARLALARLALFFKDEQQFEAQLAEVRKISPDNPDLLALEAAHAQLSGDTQDAQRLLATLFDQQPTTATLILLAHQVRANGDSDGAIALMRGWLADHADDITVRAGLADMQVRKHELDKAAHQYKEIISRDGDNLFALNNLAWILKDTDPKQALDYARKAVAAAPGVAALSDTLAVVLLKNQRVDEARQVIDSALAVAPDKTSLHFHSAQIKAAAGDKAGAVAVLTDLLASKDNFAERAEAEQLLAKLQ